MTAWIAELWRAISRDEWGTDELIGTVDDLCNLADCGLVDGRQLDRALEGRCASELAGLERRRPRKWAHDWIFRMHGVEEEDAA